MNVEITGAKIYYVIPGLEIPITSTVVNTWLVMLLIVAACKWLTHGMHTKGTSKRQLLAETLVKTTNNWVHNNMGESYVKGDFPSFVGALFSMSVLCSLLSLFGLYPPTADFSAMFGWSLMVFVMITATKIKTNKVGGYLKGFTKPIFVLTPLNIVSELSTPLSMAFRHFGNIASGQVVGTLLYAALLVLNKAVFGWVPGILGRLLEHFPITQIGIPAVLSIYFDLFSGFMQAFIFCMLTMNYIKSASETD